MKGETAASGVTETIVMTCSECGGARDHRVTVVVESALTRGGLLANSDERPTQRMRVLKCDDCEHFTRVKAV